MNDSIRLSGPQRLLLATDLSVRCDRPLERAKQLAGEWQAQIVVLAVREMPQAPGEVVQWLDGDVASSRAERLRRDFMCDTLVVRAGKRDGDA